jgi:RNA polymerase subunit RPABC4/transcription elongation factor Spt4
MCTAKPLLELRAFEVEMAIEKLNRHKSPGIDQNPADLIKAGVRTVRCEIYKCIVCIWNKEQLSEEWKGLVIVSVYNMGDKTGCSNHSGMSLLPTAYTMLSNILLSRLTPYAEEITGDRQRGF